MAPPIRRECNAYTSEFPLFPKLTLSMLAWLDRIPMLVHPVHYDTRRVGRFLAMIEKVPVVSGSITVYVVIARRKACLQ